MELLLHKAQRVSRAADGVGKVWVGGLGKTGVEQQVFPQQ